MIRPTIKTGLIGSSIQRSSSPDLHVSEARALDLPYTYDLFDLDLIGGISALPAVLDQMERDGFAGCNVTFPVKQAVIPLLSALTPEAEAMGAVNAVRFGPDGRREGHNTDWTGFGRNLRETLGSGPLGRVTLIGAGGAGAAAAYALANLGATHLTVVDRDEPRAADLAARASSYGISAEALPLALVDRALAASDGLVQATPIGMGKFPGMPIDPALLRPEMWVAEIIYVPVETELLRHARAIGCRTVSGVGMVVAQAAEAFEIFTGIKPDAARMLRNFRVMTYA